MEQRETRPKLSAPASRSERILATPTPRARINGTVIGPVGFVELAVLLVLDHVAGDGQNDQEQNPQNHEDAEEVELKRVFFHGDFSSFKILGARCVCLGGGC